MTPPDLPGPGSRFPEDGASSDLRSRPAADAMRFESILFGQPGGGSGVDGLAEPDFFVDLNLDQVLRSMTAGREQYELKPFFYAPLHEIEPLPTSYGEDSYRRIFGTADSNRASSSARAYVAGGPVGADPQHRGTGP